MFLDEVVEIWKDIPEIFSSWQIAGAGQQLRRPGTLVPWDERERSQQEVQQELQGKLGGVAGMEMFTFGNPSLPGSDAGLPGELRGRLHG
jgi:multidrug efflux pump subunit AcrB